MLSTGSLLVQVAAPLVWAAGHTPVVVEVVPRWLGP
jgi:hypothetical protein